MNLTVDEIEKIKEKAYQKGYEKGKNDGFEKGYLQGVDYSDSCLIAHIEELEEEVRRIKNTENKLVR